MNKQNKKRATALTDTVARGVTSPLERGYAKLQKIVEETMLVSKNDSVRVLTVRYCDTTGFSTIKQFSFDGNMSYDTCLRRLPMKIELNDKQKELRLAKINEYLNINRIN